MHTILPGYVMALMLEEFEIGNSVSFFESNWMIGAAKPKPEGPGLAKVKH